MGDEMKTYQARTLPEGWRWRSFSDGSGDIRSPDGTEYFSYDLQTSEYMSPSRKEMVFMPGYPTERMGQSSFYALAEKWINENLLKVHGSEQTSYDVTRDKPTNEMRTTGKTYFTNEQKQAAISKNHALDYIRSQGYDFISKGRDYTLRDHTSMVFKEDGSWFWNGQNLHGRAIEFIMYYEQGLATYHAEAYKNAILKLAGAKMTNEVSRRSPTETKSLPKPQFELPEQNDSYKRVFAYLTKTRGIDSDLVSQLMKEKKIYESKGRNNAVFVFSNSNGEAKGAALRGTSTDPRYQFKGMVSGSDRAESCFVFGGNKSATVACVFEGSIDALSYASLQKQAGNLDISRRYYLATGGAGDTNVLAFLKAHPSVTSVIMCQDNDATGNKFASDLSTKLRGMGYQVSRCKPKSKDFNDDLISEQSRTEKARDIGEQGEPQKARQISSSIAGANYQNQVLDGTPDFVAEL